MYGTQRALLYERTYIRLEGALILAGAICIRQKIWTHVRHSEDEILAVVVVVVVVVVYTYIWYMLLNLFPVVVVLLCPVSHCG